MTTGVTQATGVTAVPGSGGGASPVTTKGDLFGFTSVAARVPVGADGTVLTADSTAAAGLSYKAGGSFTNGTYDTILFPSGVAATDNANLAAALTLLQSSHRRDRPTK